MHKQQEETGRFPNFFIQRPTEMIVFGISGDFPNGFCIVLEKQGGTWFSSGGFTAWNLGKKIFLKTIQYCREHSGLVARSYVDVLKAIIKLFDMSV